MMKQILNFFILFALIQTSLYGADQNSIVFDKKLYDFGKVGQHQKVSTVFYYTNKSDSVINIKKVNKTCGCTVAEISKRWLRPNESGKIKIKLDTRSYKGTITRRVYFETDPELKPSPQIMIKATVIYFNERINIRTSIESAKNLVLIIHGYVH